ncbi:MAG TPA: ABC transporter substrate-binding protein [Caldimonas sp.]|jgi:branched-chain amino acid transport system substrate-binding protein|nr:ABC transporter substrate-binding protein [Caldimonas sp.]HEX4234444.1 ABC transporter substrate-binding protein [Caldimonas sp.]
MKHLPRLFAAAALVVSTTFAVAADLKVGLVTSLSGPTSSIGIPYGKGMQAALAFRPEIAGHKVQLIVLDDASDPTAAARNARKLVEEDKVDILMGSSGVPSTMAVAGVGRESKTPMIALTPIGLAGPEGAWVVTVAQPTTLMVNAVIEKMKQAGVKTVAYIGFSDAWGDLVYDALMKGTEGTGIKVVTNERYARPDTSVSGQVLKIIAAHPDAVMTGGSGTPGALPYLALAERGYKGGIYGNHGLINPDFVRVAGDSAQGLISSTGPVVVAEQLPAGNPLRKMAEEFRASYLKVNGTPSTDAFSAYAFDAWMVFADAASRAVAKAEPGTPAFRNALHDAIVTTKEVIGTHGVYNFNPDSRYGQDERARVVVRLDKGKWMLVP